MLRNAWLHTYDINKRCVDVENSYFTFKYAKGRERHTSILQTTYFNATLKMRKAQRQLTTYFNAMLKV